jgi:hypothetical protein
LCMVQCSLPQKRCFGSDILQSYFFASFQEARTCTSNSRLPRVSSIFVPLFFAKCGIRFVYSCYLICIRKENGSGLDIKGYTFDDYLAVLASGGIYIYIRLFC